MKIRQWTSLMPNRKTEEKWTEPKRTMGHHQKDQHIHCRSPRRERGREHSKKEWLKKLPKFGESRNINIQEAQKLPSKMNLVTHWKHSNQTSKRQEQILKATREKQIIPHRGLSEYIEISYQKCWRPEDSIAIVCKAQKQTTTTNPINQESCIQQNCSKWGRNQDIPR